MGNPLFDRIRHRLTEIDVTEAIDAAEAAHKSLRVRVEWVEEDNRRLRARVAELERLLEAAHGHIRGLDAAFWRCND